MTGAALFVDMKGADTDAAVGVGKKDDEGGVLA